MKKVFLISVIFATVLAVSSTAMAKKDTEFTCAPTWVAIDTTDPAVVCFDWDWVNCQGTPVKYSIDVELLVVGEDWNDPLAETQKLSFGTGEEEASDDTFLCVPVEAFVYWDGVEKEGVYVPFSGDAAAKVKALGKGPGFRQNNAFSVYEEFVVEQPVPVTP